MNLRGSHLDRCLGIDKREDNIGTRSYMICEKWKKQLSWESETLV